MPAIASTRDIRLPLDAFRLTYREWSALALAEARLTKECADRFNVDYLVSAARVLRGAIPTYTFDAYESRYAYRYYINDSTAARERGYLVPPGPPHDIADPTSIPADDDTYARIVISGLEPGPIPPRLAGPSGRAEAGPGAYPTGVERPKDANGDPLPEGGCAGEARSVLAGGGELHNVFYANEVGSEAYFRALEDSRVREVTRQWSDCMAERGFDYADPESATGDPAWLDLDDEMRPLPEEIAVAVVDVECKEKVNYLGVRVAIEAAYQNLVIEARFEDLTRNYRNAEQMLQRANKIEET